MSRQQNHKNLCHLYISASGPDNNMVFSFESKIVIMFFNTKILAPNCLQDGFMPVTIWAFDLTYTFATAVATNHPIRNAPM